MLISRVFVGLATVGLLLACSGGPAQTGAEKCYSLVEGDSTTTLVLGGFGESATITTHETKAGVAVAAPMTAPGRLEDDAFVYPDGTRLVIDDSSLTWPADSLLAGAEFQAVACP